MPPMRHLVQFHMIHIKFKWQGTINSYLQQKFVLNALNFAEVLYMRVTDMNYLIFEAKKMGKSQK